MKDAVAAHGKSKILITGGLGFIFSHVTEFYVKKGWDVVVIDNCSAGSHPEIINNSFKHYNIDVANPEALDITLKEQPDYIIHAAAISDVDYSINNAYVTLQTNFLASLHMFEAARNLPRLKKFLYVSTDEVYGECPVRKSEKDILSCRNPYSASKAFGSVMRPAFENTYSSLKDKIVESRFCNVFGHRQDERKIMPIIKRALETGEPVPVFDEGGSYREYIHVSNIPPAVELILEHGNGIYNVTSNDGFRVSDLIKKAEEVTGKKVPVVKSHRPGIDMKYQMENSRISSLGWKPVCSFEEGLGKYLN